MTELLSDQAELVARIEDLERLNREHLEFLDLLLSLDNSLVGIRHDGNHATVLGMVCAHLRRLLPLGTTAFYLVDQHDFSYSAVYYDPREGFAALDALVNTEIESGVFAWALRNNRALFRPSSLAGTQLVLHPLATPSRTVGMMAALWESPQQPAAALMLLSVVMSTTAYALENARLQTELRDYNLKLELAVRERTDQAIHEARRAEQANRAKSDFLSTMSHELRTPMNGVLGMTSLLAATTLTTEQREYVEHARGCGRLMLDLVNDVLDLAKIEAGQLTLQNRPFAPATIVDDVVGVLAKRAEDKGLDLVHWVGGNVPQLVEGDSSRLRQVLFNLLSNAVKFTDRGSVSVRMSLLSSGQPAHPSDAVILRVAVSDTGIGISTADKTRLFQPFTQLDSAIARSEPGTGLGLTISRRLVTAMGGSLELESTLDVGTQAIVTLRLRQLPTPEEQGKQPALEGTRVMVIDDHATRRACLGGQLREWGCVTEERASALEFLQTPRTGTPDLLVLTRECWLSLERTLRTESCVAERHLPVLVVCALGDMNRSDSTRDERRMQTVSRPPKLDQLRRLIWELTHPSSVVEIQERTSNPLANPCAKSPLAGQRVLIVEDNVVNQMVADGLLKQLGAETRLANDGSQALRILDEHPIDLILMDCRMPVMNGYEATREIRAREAERGGHVRIVGLTANAFAGDRELCLTSGMDDYLAKPVMPDELRRVLEGLKHK